MIKHINLRYAAFRDRCFCFCFFAIIPCQRECLTRHNQNKKKRKRDFVWEAECIVGLLKELNQKQLTGNLFIDLLKEFIDLMKQEIARELKTLDDEESAGINKER